MTVRHTLTSLVSLSVLIGPPSWGNDTDKVDTGGTPAPKRAASDQGTGDVSLNDMGLTTTATKPQQKSDWELVAEEASANGGPARRGGLDEATVAELFGDSSSTAAADVVAATTLTTDPAAGDETVTTGAPPPSISGNLPTGEEVPFEEEGYFEWFLHGLTLGLLRSNEREQQLEFLRRLKSRDEALSNGTSAALSNSFLNDPFYNQQLRTHLAEYQQNKAKKAWDELESMKSQAPDTAADAAAATTTTTTSTTATRDENAGGGADPSAPSPVPSNHAAIPPLQPLVAWEPSPFNVEPYGHSYVYSTPNERKTVDPSVDTSQFPEEVRQMAQAGIRIFDWREPLQIWLEKNAEEQGLKPYQVLRMQSYIEKGDLPAAWDSETFDYFAEHGEGLPLEIEGMRLDISPELFALLKDMREVKPFQKTTSTINYAEAHTVNLEYVLNAQKNGLLTSAWARDVREWLRQFDDPNPNNWDTSFREWMALQGYSRTDELWSSDKHWATAFLSQEKPISEWLATEEGVRAFFWFQKEAKGHVFKIRDENRQVVDRTMGKDWYRSLFQPPEATATTTTTSVRASAAAAAADSTGDVTDPV